MTENPNPPPHQVERGFYTPVGSRRSFFSWVTRAIFACIGLGLAVPLGAYVISPAFKRREKPWRSVGKIHDLAVGEPRSLDYATILKDGWLETEAHKSIWAVKQPDDTVTVFSPICPHLGCGYRWDGQDRKFKCPCHGSVYDLSGKVLGGPAPRSLDVLPSKVENGELLVLYKEFKSGLTEKREL